MKKSQNIKKYSIYQLIISLLSKVDNYRKKRIIILLILMFLSALGEVLNLALIIPFVTILSSPKDLLEVDLIYFLYDNFNFTQVNDLILPITLSFIISIFISSAIKLVTLWFSFRLSASIGSEITSMGFTKIINQPYDWHIYERSSEIIVALTSSTNKLVNFTRDTLQIIISVLIISLLSISLCFIEPIIFLLAFLMISFSYLSIVYILKNKLEIYSKIIKRKSINLVQSTQDAFGSLVNIKLDNTYENYIYSFKLIEKPLRKVIAKSSFFAQFPKYLIEGFSMIFLILLSYSLYIKSGNQALIVKIGVLAFAAQKMLPEFQKIFSSWAQLKTNKSSVIQVLDILNKPYFQEIIQSDLVPYCPKKEINLCNIYFSYPKNNFNTLSNINLKIKIGEKIGIVGKTGSGKSTFLRILMGLLKPTKGRFFLDDIDLIKEKDINLLQRFQLAISYVPQDFYIKGGSIIENIAYGQNKDSFDLSKAYRALETSQLLDFVNQSEFGLSMPVGERGITLSGGQKQRLIIARALYKNPKILILDEATSALDEKTEILFIKSLRKIDCTSLIVSHRSSSLKYCDRVIDINSLG